MKKAMLSGIVAIALALISLVGVLAARATPVWPRSEVRDFGLVVLATAIVAGLLTMYFDWRATFRNRLLASRDNHRKAA